ncbi:cytochrome c peroxidase [Methylobacterium sp. WL116]|uniref:cytochrome-c peroxidase n=1 Tax=Methylobacterium sp. WL116 TaxID=2603889 RepID=UPI0011C8D027|nr:cytochrome c peroxidase [Methylobacterium sp. WL116]TXM87799.1 c-type cytochrome [Methylobacterium sp. WL116]
MRWKLGGGIAAIVMLGAVCGPATSGPAAQRAAWREAYAPPSAIPFPETNPYAQAKAELGRKLFFDPILSADRDRACVTCHLPNLAWADGRKRAPARNDSDMDLRTPSLLNIAWQEGRLGWDGKFRDLESVAFVPISAPGNMGLPADDAVARLSADAAYAAAFAEAFADPGVTKDRIEAALATFQRLIVSGVSPFDRWIAGDETAIPVVAKRGFDLFNGRANCAACHGGWAFTDGSFHDIGTATGADLGRGRFVPSSEALRYAFKTPGLREVAGRGAYMHDGSIATLEAVIDLYDRGGIARPSRSPEIRPLNLTGAEKADLLAFLQTLTAPAGNDRALADLTGDAPKP